VIKNRSFYRQTPSLFTFSPHFAILFNDLKENDRVLRKEQKEKIISTNKVHAADTGSAEVQIALLSERINLLTKHMTLAKKDYHSRTGLMKLVGQRKRLLAYMKKEDSGRYEKLIQRLGLRK
jgi:small subunit ribosomal protein S15